MKIVQNIKNILEKSLNNLDIDFKGGFNLDHPQDLKNGDFTTNIAMMLAGKEKKNPRELTGKIKEEIEKLLEKENNNNWENAHSENANLKNAQSIEKVEIAGPGYLNFYLSKSFYKNSLEEILEKKEKWGENKKLQKKTYLSEKTAPNLFKPFHIGHLVNISFGESLTRVFKISGAKTIEAVYPSDVSLGIAKAIWGLIDMNKSNNFTIDDMGKAYAYGTQKHEENKARIIEINKSIYAKKESLEYEVYKRGVKINIDYFKKITKRLGSEFQEYIFESEAGEKGLEVVKKHTSSKKGKGIFEKSNGAVIFDGERRGAHTRVFVNSEGLPTYEGKDMGLLALKFEKFDFDKSVIYTDMEQQKVFEVEALAAKEINKEWFEKSVYLQHGRLNFVSGKISSRYGNVPLAEDLIDTVKKNIFEIVKEKDFSEEEKDKMAESIAIGALKYSFLKVTMGKNMTFDFKKSLDFSGNSGPYLQYSYVRARSILAKAEKRTKTGLSLKEGETVDLEKLLSRFPEKVFDSLESYSPHHIANHLYDLASEFNSFYAHTKILDQENSDYSYNLAITEAFAQTMKNGLYLLGIETVERM